MSTAKFEKLIELLINEDQERAEQLFHEIVVEKSRGIYESLMDEDMSSGLMDEVSAETEGMDGMMEDDEFVDDEEIDGDYDVDMDDAEGDMDDAEMDMDDAEVDMDADELEGEEEEAGIEDRVVDLEDKLDELMAEFEDMMGRDDDAEMDMDDAEDDMDDAEMDMDDAESDEDEIFENVEMKKVPGLYGSKISSDSPDGKRSGPVDANSGQKGMDSKPVNFTDGGSETVPTKPAKPSGYAAKGETEQPLAKQYQNKPGQNASIAKSGKGQQTPEQYGNGKSTAQGKEAGAGSASVSQDKRSPIPESRRTAKRRI
jgi:hypothetical protein